MLRVAKPKVGAVAPLVAGLTVLAIATMAASVPDAPIEFTGKGGFLIGLGGLSDQIAMQIGEKEYGYLVVDLTEADASDDALWREYLHEAQRRSVPVWGWMHVREPGDIARARAMARNLHLKGFYIYSRDAIADARKVTTDPKTGDTISSVRVVPVLRSAGPQGTTWAQVVDLETMLSDRRPPLAILSTNGLSSAQIAQARAAGADDFVISRVAILPLDGR